MSWSTFDNHAAAPEQVRAYGEAVVALQAFHDALAAAAPGPDLLERLAADLRSWADTLSPMAVEEVDRLSGRIQSLPARGQLAVPPYVIRTVDAQHLEGTVTFGAYFMGGGAAAHGGSILTVFDEVLGAHAAADGRGPARTAYLRTDFRSIVPIDVPVTVRARLERTEGRKRFMRGEMWAGGVLCAEADALFVELREGSR